MADHPAPPSRVRIEIHLAEPAAAAVHAELRAALTGSPRSIPSKYFYDDVGSELFERICELPEYYPTRTEAALLEQVAAAIAEQSGARELVELGSGAARKTRRLLDAMSAVGAELKYVPVDVSAGMLRRTAEELTREYPRLVVHGLVADFMTDLGELPEGGRRLVAFLGGTIGNLDPEREAVDFLRHVRRSMAAEDCFLLGTDLIKDLATLEAAYNDSLGVTAEFNRNILRVVNARFGGDFDPAAFEHLAFYDRENDWIEMRLLASRAQRVRVAALDLDLELVAGEPIRTEISAKFDRPKVERLLERGGFRLSSWFVDPANAFALSLARLA